MVQRPQERPVVADPVGHGRPATTGSDTSAGPVTRAVAALLLVLLAPPALARRGAGWAARGLGRGAAAGAGPVAAILRATSRVAATALRPVAAGVVVAAGLAAAGLVAAARAVSAALRLAGATLRTAGHLAATALRPVAAALAVAARSAAAAAAAAAGLVWRAVVAAAPLVRLSAAFVWAASMMAVQAAGWALRWAARPFAAGWQALRPLVAFAMVAVSAAAAWAGSAARAACGAAISVLAAAGRLSLLVGRPVIEALARVAVLLVSAAGTAMSLLAQGARAVAGAMVMVCGPMARTAASVVHALATVAWRGMGVAGRSFTSAAVWTAGWLAVAVRAAGAPLRPLGRAARVVAASMGAVVAGAVGRAARAGRRVAAALGRTGAGVLEGSRVAAGTARHRAGVLTAGGTDDPTGWRPGEAAQAEEAVDPSFVVVAHHNRHLGPGASEVTSVLEVWAEDMPAHGAANEAVEVFMVDCSASMGHPWDKIRAARAATCAAIDCLRDGVWFAVVRGDERATVAFPRKGGLVQASAASKRAAAAAVQRLQPVGGTAIGRWVELAGHLMALRPSAIHHALLLTDGKDENESADELDAALERWEGSMQCDCRGVGTDWAVGELRKVSSALLGTVGIIREAAEMEDDFRRVTEAAMRRQVEATLRLWLPAGATVDALQQVSPTIVDLTRRGRPVAPQAAQTAQTATVVDYPTGAWGEDRRHYLLRVKVPPAPAGARMLATRATVRVGGRDLGRAAVGVEWTDDTELSAPLDPEVAHWSGQEELSRAVQEGLLARRTGDLRAATMRLGRAVQIAAECGNEATSELLRAVVDVDDVSSGTVRLRQVVDEADEMELDTRSTRTTRSRA